MAATERRTFSLPREQSEYIDELVSTGTYATSSEVIRAGLRALQERDAVVDGWLREEVVPAMQAAQAEPGSLLPLDDVFENIRAIHAGRL